MRLNINIVFYREFDRWIAHCLEFDLFHSGATHVVALKGLMEAIVLQVECDNLANLFSPAPGYFFWRFAEGGDVVVNLESYIKQLSEGYPMIVEGIAVREYVDRTVDNMRRRTLVLNSLGLI